MRELERTSSPTPLGDPAGTVIAPIAIIGQGRVGGSVARAARQAGIEIRVAGRPDALDACRDARCALLCVPDAAIVDACEAVAEAIPPLRFVGHTSGAATLNRLAAAVARGAGAFSLHPLQTIPDDDTELRGAPCAVAGTGAEALGVAITLADRLGMQPFEVSESDRAAYHAAASIASNFLITLEQFAADVLERIGADDARELLAPLVLRTARNWAEHGAEALTGPIARGDESTVESHVAALRELDPQAVELYELLAARTRELAGRNAQAEVGA